MTRWSIQLCFVCILGVSLFSSLSSMADDKSEIPLPEIDISEISDIDEEIKDLDALIDSEEAKELEDMALDMQSSDTQAR